MRAVDLIKNNKAVILIIALGIAVFANTFWNGFVYDDDAFIVENKSIRSLKNIPGYFVSAQYFSAKGEFSIYRPIVTLTFALDYKLWKLNPAGYHILNTLFHVLGGIMVYLVLVVLIKKELPALVGGLIFVVHPVQTEAVSWIAGRGNTMCLFLCMLSFYYYTKFRDRVNKKRDKYYRLSIIVYAVALLTKEMAICFPLILIAYDYLMFPGNWSKIIYRKKWDFSLLKEYVPYFILSVLYLALRYFAIGRVSQQSYWGGGIVPTMLTMSKVFVYYTRLMFLPVNLCVDYSIPVSKTLFEPFVIFSILFIAGLLFCAFRVYKYSKLATFGIFWFIIALLPVSNIVPLQALIAERFLYMPSVGFCIIAAVVTSKSIKRVKSDKIVYALIAVIIILYSTATVSRNADWRSNFTLWSKTLDGFSKSYKALTSLGVHYSDEEEYEKAIEYYLKSLEINPNFNITYNNLGNTYQKVEKYDAAIKEYETAIRLNGNYYEAYANMGNAYKRLEKYDAALANYEKALSIKDSYVDARFNLGVTYGDLGREDEAIEAYGKVVKEDPYHAEAYNNLAVIYRDRGMIEKAIETFKAAVKRDPEYADAYYNLAIMYNTSRVDMMIEGLEKVVELDSEFNEAHYNLGVAYASKGMNKKAVGEYIKELEINPGHVSANKNAGILYHSSGENDKTIYYWEKYLEVCPAAPDRAAVVREIKKLKLKQDE